MAPLLEVRIEETIYGRWRATLWNRAGIMHATRRASASTLADAALGAQKYIEFLRAGEGLSEDDQQFLAPDARASNARPLPNGQL